MNMSRIRLQPILLLILLTYQFARSLGDVAKGKLPKDAAMSVIGLSAMQYLTVLIPIGLFLAVMMALGRLYRDSEMAAMTACRAFPVPSNTIVGAMVLPWRANGRRAPYAFGSAPYEPSLSLYKNPRPGVT